MSVAVLQQYINDPTDQEQFGFIQTDVEDVLLCGEPADQEEYADYLYALMTKFSADLDRKNKDALDRYQSWWLELSFKAFDILSHPNQQSLLQKRIYAAVARGYDPDALVRDYFKRYEYEIVKNNFENYAKDLEQNIETVGNVPIEVEGKKLVPQLKYWLMDYDKFPTQSAKRSSVDRVNYINQSANVRQLTQKQRQNLLAVFKLYDDFINADSPLIYEQHSETHPSEQPHAEIHAAPEVPDEHMIDEKLQELEDRIAHKG